jgi:hypothetical protein
MVCNLMALNGLINKDSYPLPKMKRVIEATTGSNFITVLN